MTETKASSRQQRYRESMRKRGFSEVMVWVHKEDREALKEFAQQLREERKAA